MATILAKATSIRNLKRELRVRRLWYHDIELASGLRTRFPEDYEVNPVLRSVDAGNAELEARLEAHLPPDLSGLTILDLGCADGRFTFWAARRGARHVTGIERNRHNYDHARFISETLDLHNVTLHHGSIERFGVNETFDVIFCVGLIYHLINPLGALHALHTRCKKKLFLASPLDLPDGDGSPMCRLDRYATGAHGMWSFNVPMLRQLLTTAGFSIEQEQVNEEQRGQRRYFAVATPGELDDHHIFAETLDQEFPINLERRRKRVRECWRALADTADGPVALFGAGTHTPWMLDEVADIPGVRVECILDDRIPVQHSIRGLEIRRPTEVDPTTLSTVVISSWYQTEAILRRARRVFGDRVRIVSVDGGI